MKPAGLATTTGAEWIGRAPHEGLQRGRPVLPDDDPFCDPPVGFEHAAPGTVLRSRDVELAFMGLIPQKFTATQLLYRSTDRNGIAEPVGCRHCVVHARRRLLAHRRYAVCLEQRPG